MKYIKTLEKENMFGKENYFIIEIRGEFDLNNIRFETFNSAMNYMNFNYEELTPYFGKEYKIFEIQKKSVNKDQFIMWENQRKYNL
jgi:hypothetical protein